jgi:carbamoyl-phosphate synthase large subunit
MEERTIIVTGIGGNVGQGIVRNLRNTGMPLRIVGTNSAPFSAGNHLVDAFHEVPFAFDPGYLDRISQIVEEESVDLIIPSTDFEVFYLASSADRFSARLATSGVQASGIYLDKFLTWEHHNALGIPFAKSFLPSEWRGQFESAIAKPRKGRGSRGLLKGKFDATLLTDDEYMVQEMHAGLEITCAVFVSYLSGEITGILTMDRSLENGATSFCRVVKDWDVQLREMAELMVRHSDLKGSFNIQAIVTEQNEVIPFEVNCRISGTNSIRTHFGFADVAWTMQELLYNQPAPIPQIREGLAQRILMDVIYPDAKSVSDLKRTNKDNFFLY